MNRDENDDKKKLDIEGNLALDILQLYQIPSLGIQHTPNPQLHADYRLQDQDQVITKQR
jgi:hypothetical protein